MTESYSLLTEQAELERFCERAGSASFLALDTEFVRQRTYFAKLGLIQIAVDDQLVLVDPLAIADLRPLWQLLANPSIRVVIHAGGEDYEILGQAMGTVPNNVFDTQIAAAFLGMGDALGYAALVERFGGPVLDKSQSRTDWTARPLSEEQLRYAAADVTYLQQIYPQLAAQLDQQPQLRELVLAETHFQVAKRQQQTPSELLYLFFGNAWQCRGSQLVALQKLLKWRFERAQAQDIPLSFVAKDNSLLELARKLPQQRRHLHSISELSPVTIRYAGEAILELIAAAQHESSADLVELQRLTDMRGYKAAYKAIKQVLDAQAEALNIGVGLIGSRRQINDVIHWFWQIPPALRKRLPKPDLLSSWRGELLAATLTELLEN